MKCVVEGGNTFLPKNWSSEYTDLLEAERERSIHDFTVSTAPVQNIENIITGKFEM